MKFSLIYLLIISIASCTNINKSSIKTTTKNNKETISDSGAAICLFKDSVINHYLNKYKLAFNDSVLFEENTMQKIFQNITIQHQITDSFISINNKKFNINQIKPVLNLIDTYRTIKIYPFQFRVIYFYKANNQQLIVIPTCYYQCNGTNCRCWNSIIYNIKYKSIYIISGRVKVLNIKEQIYFLEERIPLSTSYVPICTDLYALYQLLPSGKITQSVKNNNQMCIDNYNCINCKENKFSKNITANWFEEIK